MKNIVRLPRFESLDVARQRYERTVYLEQEKVRLSEMILDGVDAQTVKEQQAHIAAVESLLKQSAASYIQKFYAKRRYVP